MKRSGYQRGEDGKLHTADDVDLGPVDVTWSVEEFRRCSAMTIRNSWAHLNATGALHAHIRWAQPERKFSRNNYGDVWIVATAKNEKDKDGKPLTGRSYLVVTVPTYIRWDQPEVTQ